MAQCGIVVVVTLLVTNVGFARNEIASVSKINNPNWWKNSVIYQIYPRSFKDSNGDGVGDINGITSKLDYLVSTGINAVWLSPIFKSPMVDFGYDISNFKEIDPIFGTMEDFENLRNKTMEKGIKLILDFVPNHSSDQHEWFQKSVMNESKYKDYFIWGNGRLIEETYEELPPNNWLSVFGGSAWTWNEDRGQYYYHQFTKGQPDLNYRNPEVVKDMEDVITFWLDKGIDGFRVDAVSHLFESQNISNHETRSNDPYARPGNWSALTHNLTYNQPENHGLIARWRSILDKYSEKDGNTRIMFTESYGSPKDVLAYYGNNTVPEAHFPFNFDLILKINNDSKAQEFKNVIEEQPTKFSRNWVIGNHDQNRVASRLGRDMVDIMNMLVLLLPGTAITYSGEEIGMEDTFVSWNETKDPPGLLAGRKKYAIYSRDPERTPFQWDATNYAGFSTNKPWLPVNENYKELNLENQTCASKSHYKTYKQLLEARKHPAIQSGDLKVQILAHDVLSFTRGNAGSESFLIIMNLGISLAHVDFSIYKTMKGNFTIFATSMNSTLQEGSVVSTEVMLQPKEAVVLITPARSPLSSFKTASSAYQHSVATFQLILLVACQFIFFSR